MTWYYEANGQSQGPVAEAEISRLLAAGTINEKTLIWREGLSAWTPLGEIWPPGGGAATPAPATASAGGAPPEGWIRCTATGKYFPPNEIVYIAGKPYSLEAKDSVVQGVIQTGTAPGDLAERNGPAWERRQELGIWQAGWQTTKAALLNPVETFSTMKREGGIANPLLFLVVFGSIGGIIGIGYQLFMQLAMTSALPAEARQAQLSGPFGAGLTTGIWIALAVAMPVLIAVGSFITAGIIHLSLMICGGAKQPFETTFRAYCYSNGAAALLQLIPLCGAYITGIWGLVCLCIGISKSHEINGGRAVLSVLLPFILCCGSVFAIAMVFGFSAAFAAKGGN